MKIVYCANSICYLGGIERVTIVKANALAAVESNDVYVVVTDNQRNFRVSPLSPNVHLIDLRVNYFEDDWKSRWHSLESTFVKRRWHKRRLTEVLREIQPDIVVSVGHSEKYFLPTIRGRWKTVREIHFASNYRMLEANTGLQKLVAKANTAYDLDYKVWRYDKIVLLTEEDKDLNWKASPKVTVIPNPLTFQIPDALSPLSAKRFIAAGRLTAQKNFASLIRAFSLVAKRHPDWTLDIYGEGGEKHSLQQQIERCQMTNNIFLRGYTSDIREKMLEASGYVLSSRFEGFGLVLIEAMSCGLPVVSYTCPCGPKDVVTDGSDGFLVPVDDEKALADRMCRLIEDGDLRRRMGQAARGSSERYNIDVIVEKWMSLFCSLLKK